MSSTRKRHLSPLAGQDPSPRKVPRPNVHTEQRVAMTECEPRVIVPPHKPGEVDRSVFVFGDVQGMLGFSSARNIGSLGMHSFSR